MKNDRFVPESESELRAAVPIAVIRRLPRYYRYLRELIRQGKTRISSADLSRIMHVTASQIRQDLNYFGGFGQQGYGYNVNYLYAKICELLGVGEGYRAIVLGAGNLGRALVRSPMFERRGVDVIAMFDIDPAVIGTKIADIPVYGSDTLGEFCRENQVDIAVLTLPKDSADEMVARSLEYGIEAIWNFTGVEYNVDPTKAIIEEIHLGDSLMTMCYELRELRRKAKEGK